MTNTSGPPNRVLRIARIRIPSRPCSLQTPMPLREPSRTSWFAKFGHESEGFSMNMVTYRKVDVDGIGVFYREAGPKDAPTILLLHGFPTASHMFRDLIPQLADRFRLVAPDLPGFGQSDMPARNAFTYTFENIATVIDRFTEVIAL